VEEDQEQPEECCGCSYEQIPLQRIEHVGCEVIWLCELCRVTFCGTAAMYPHSGYDAPVLSTIVYCANAILDEIRKMAKNGS
jgi:hypothetical protein